MAALLLFLIIAVPQQPAEEAKPPDHSGHGAAHARVIEGGPFQQMEAIGSGTALLPASSPMAMWHAARGDWTLMLHGDLKVGFNRQPRPRGVDKAESQNWIMLAAQRPAGRGSLTLRAMASFETWTAPRRGFPQLFQTGETFEGRPIIDAQHPHDLFMELAASYHFRASEQIAVHFYGGPVGEPALGPVAFMHRPSASENPAAPLGHHWQDSTHITHGVITTGVTAWRFRFEGSIFHGREPDENRRDIELGKLDSWSTRVSFTPTKDWALQWSRGHLVAPDALDPVNETKTTASIAHNRRFRRGNWATTLVWGRDSVSIGKSDSYLLESTLNFRARNWLYTRVELGDKFRLFDRNIWGKLPLVTLAAPLQRAALQAAPGAFPPPVLHPAIFHGPPTRVASYTAGGVRDIVSDGKVRVGVGSDVTFYSFPEALERVYGSNPVSYRIFVRLRPGSSGP